MGDSLYKSTDGGNSWNALSLPSPWSSDIYILNSDIGWVAENWGPSSIWHDSLSIYITTNGGETWIRQSSLQGAFLNNIVFVDMFKGWASIITKIYYTSDSGQFWICQFESEPIEYIIDIFFLNDNNGWALTDQGNIIKYTVSTEVFAENSENIHLDEYIVSQNYPNPFNSSTRISYSIPNSDFVTVKIYDLFGREIQTLINEFQNTGMYSVSFDASELSSGIYFYKLQVGSDFIETKKMLFLR